MSDVIEGRRIENNDSQGSSNPPQQFERYETQPQAYQLAANERAQRHIPKIELKESDTSSSANKYGQLTQDMRPADTGTGAKKPGQPTWGLQQDATRGGAPKKPPGSPEDALRTAREKAEKFGFDLNKTTDANKKGEQAGKTPGGKAADGQEHIDKTPADAKTPDGIEHMDKTEADASEDESAGAADGRNGDAENPRGEQDDPNARVKAKEEARAAYQSFGLTSPPREFESVRDAVAEANKAIGRRYMARNQ